MTTRFKIGDRVRSALNKDHEYLVTGVNDDFTIDVKAVAPLDSPCLGLPYPRIRTNIFTLLAPLRLEPPAYQPLDDAGRAALKAGDEVLVRLTIAEGPDCDGELKFVKDGVRAPRTSLEPYLLPSAVYALLPKTPEPIAVGDKLRSTFDSGFTNGYTCVGFTSDGKVVAEYEAGGETNVVARDASCWEKVS